MPEKGIIKPCRLRKGDTIGIVAPACSFDKKKFKKGVKTLKDLGFKVKYDLIIFKKYWSMAGYDIHRGRQINRMFADKEVKAIFCAQAGYGSIRTLPYLDASVIGKNPKIFVGYSDITVLLSYLFRVAGMILFHGPVVSGEMNERMNPVSLDLMLRSICDTEPLGEMAFPGMKTLRGGKASGRVVGGNMSLLSALIGTPYDMDTDGRIVFLEDVGEDLEVIDRYLMHMRLSGKFKKAKGIIFGRMKDCVDYSGYKYTMRDILDDILKDVKVPIIWGFPSGHRDFGEVNVTMPMGVRVTIDADKTSVKVDEPAVS